MKALLDFFALRPVFTRWGLRAVWFACLFEFALQLYSLTWGTFAAYGASQVGVWSSFVIILLPPLVNIVLVRLLLEVATAILLDRAKATEG